MKGLLSIIIPIAEKEEAWKILIEDLRQVPGDSEVIFTCSNHRASFEQSPEFLHFKNSRTGTTLCLTSDPGRAKQLNCAVLKATKPYLWFLHADSRFTEGTVSSLEKVLRSEQINALYFFDLQFHRDDPAILKINEFGVWFRSHWLKLPFGDQGFLISKDRFESLGGFPEDVSYGEDHVFVWKARMSGVSILPIGGRLITSGRKYRKQGWLKTTFQHIFYTWVQAFPYLFKMKTFRRKGVR